MLLRLPADCLEIARQPRKLVSRGKRTMRAGPRSTATSPTASKVISESRPTPKNIAFRLRRDCSFEQTFGGPQCP